MSGSKYKLICPHCKMPIRVRNSIAMHPLLRTIYVQCTNLGCGATFKGEMELTHMLSPSATPNPAIDIPMADSAMRLAAAHTEQSQQMDLEDLLTGEPA